MQTGVICNTSKLRTDGFGFIKPDNGGGNVFFHIRGKGNKNVKDLSHGQAVKYTQGVNAKGIYAENIAPIAGFQAELSSSSSRQPSSMEVLAGSGRRRYGFADGAGAAAHFYYPSGVAVDGEGSFIIADQTNQRVRKLTRDGTVSTLAGSGREGFADGAGAAAQFNIPIGVAVDGEGSIIIADYSNHRVRGVTPDGTVSTLAGSGSKGFADGAGAAAQFNYPYGVAVDGEGSIIITDMGNHCVRKITPDGTVSTLAGSGSEGFADGAGAAAQFFRPSGVAVDGAGSVIIADQGNHRVRKLTPDGTVSTLAGSGSKGFADGAGAAAQFSGPRGVAVDGEGSIIIADYGNERVRKITPDGTVSTLAGSRHAGFSDGARTAAEFNHPVWVAVDGEGSIIIAEFHNKRLRKITPDGTVSTLFAGRVYFRGVAIDSDGCVVVCTDVHTVAKIAGCRVAAPGAAEQKRRLAFCMLSHERLGHGSIWAGLEQGLLQMVLCNKH